MALKPYNKQAIIAVMKRRELLTGEATKAPSILDVTKWPQWWEEGAKELEKTSPGRLITAPVRLPEAVITSTTKTVKEIPGTVHNISRAIPFLIILAGVGGAGYFAYKTGLLKKLSIPKNSTLGGCDKF
jgi:hypothetical protein